ncbi:hypothetical protein ABL78_1824 [Leptomonas seymouri]|uniref:IQ calmodulin-binding protein n=1 Tax=Leptomonas seymouri TaxID=5684 RepID=A0A0N1I8D9_LEPSE|nr:hypothetical protein ABL78_1824 [Leptomonas seymouri]|eukprot:KPI89088.1 hypothetical protein ABL78_1824 [Leptomonas seymouri]
MSEAGRQRPEPNVSFAVFSSTSFGTPVAPVCGTNSRLEWSTSTTGMDGRMGRSGGNRSRSQSSVRADSYRRSEGRRMSQDTRRYMQAAAASTQTTVQQLLARLKSYQTFQTFFSHQVPYTSAGDEVQSCAASAGTLPWQRTSDRAFSSTQLWQMINGLLDTSASQLLQHNTEGHFIATLHSTLGRMSDAQKVRMVIESRSPGAAEAGNSASVSGARLSTLHRRLSAASLFSNRLTAAAAPGDAQLVERWAAEHPEATAADIAAQRGAWSALEENRRRANGRFYLRAMHEQLAALQAEGSHSGHSTAPAAVSHSGDGQCCPSGSLLIPPGDRAYSGQAGRAWEASRGVASPLEACIAHSEEELKEEKDRQRALWMSFQEEPSLAAPTSTRAAAPALSDAPRIVTAYLESADLHAWLHSSWPHRTHRHESAALRIQCAYRTYRARCEVRNMRYARRQSFVIGLVAENEARRVWDVALQMQADASKAVSGSSDGTMRALQFFIDKINAVVAKRRARKLVQQEQEREIREYVAITIQRVYRGHRARRYVDELRHPEIVAVRQRAAEERSAVIIQASWRRYREKLRWRRMWQAACTLQRAYRCFEARRLLAERRRLYVLEDLAELQRFAVRRIEMWYRRHLTQCSSLAGARLPEMRTLQRVCRGYLDRRRLGAVPLAVELRAATAIVERRRRALLDMRAAVAVKAALRREITAQQHEALRADAAITIQRAWRSRRVKMPSHEQEGEL